MLSEMVCRAMVMNWNCVAVEVDLDLCLWVGMVMVSRMDVEIRCDTSYCPMHGGYSLLDGCGVTFMSF